MRRLFLVLALLGLGASLALGQELIPFQAVPPPPAGTCTPAGAACPVGIVAPSGFHFNRVYDDEFNQDTTLNTSLWDASASCTTAPNGAPGPCSAQQLYFNSDGLNLQATQAHSGATSPGCTTCDAGLGSKFAPRFGVWEWSIRYPRGWDGSGDGYHIDTYFNNNVDTDRVEYEEVAAGGETVVGTSNSNYAQYYCCTTNGNGMDSVEVHLNINSPTRFSDAFHTFTTWWFDDGVGNGTISQYMDGNPIYTNGRQGSGWGSGGATIIMEEISCYDSSQVFANGNVCSGSTATSGNPISYKYFRYWQLVAD